MWLTRIIDIDQLFIIACTFLFEENTVKPLLVNVCICVIGERNIS